MTGPLQVELSRLRRRALDLAKWTEFARTDYARMLLADFETQIADIRKEYGCVNLSHQGHDLTLAQLQGREQEKVDFVAFLKNCEKDKISLDEQIRNCESRIKQLNSGTKRRSEPLVEPETETGDSRQ